MDWSWLGTWFKVVIGLAIIAGIVIGVIISVAVSDENIPWVVKIPTKDHAGKEVEIRVYPHPLLDGSYVVNITTEADRKRNDGTCWGTMLNPHVRDKSSKPIKAAPERVTEKKRDNAGDHNLMVCGECAGAGVCDYLGIDGYEKCRDCKGQGFVSTVKTPEGK